MSAIILPHHNKTPELLEALYIAPNATIIGDVQSGPHCSFWFGSVTRGDVHSIRIGESTNIQDLSMLHVSYKKAPLEIGSHVTIGHRCILHGCKVGNRVLVGMGTIIMDNVVIGDDVLIRAGSLITEGTQIPSGSLVFGQPAKVQRVLSLEEKAYLLRSAEHYKNVARSYNGGPWPYEFERKLGF